MMKPQIKKQEFKMLLSGWYCQISGRIFQISGIFLWK